MCDINFKFDKDMSRKINGEGKAIVSRKQNQNQNFSYMKQKNYMSNRIMISKEVLTTSFGRS